MTDTVVLVSAFGLVTAAFAESVWQWRGRSSRARRWAGTKASERLTLVGAPAAFVLACGVTVMYRLGGDLSTLSLSLLLYGLTAVSGLIIWGFMARRLPVWWGPSWLRDMTPEERVPDIRTFAGARQQMETAVRFPDPRDRLRDRAGKAVASPVRVRWVDEHVEPTRAHGLGYYGAVAGWLTADSGGIYFASSALESSVSGSTTDFTIGRNSGVGVRRIPRLTDGDGRRARRIWNLPQRLSPRVEVQAESSSWVFETWKPQAVIDLIDGPR